MTTTTTAPRTPAGPRRRGRQWDPELPLVFHALGLKLAIELDELFGALAAAETAIGALEVKAKARARAEAHAAAEESTP